jgi:hypothetical protein
LGNGSYVLGSGMADLGKFVVGNCHPHFVMLNLFQHPSYPETLSLIGRWTLKQVQGDEQ